MKSGILLASDIIRRFAVAGSRALEQQFVIIKALLFLFLAGRLECIHSKLPHVQFSTVGIAEAMQPYRQPY